MPPRDVRAKSDAGSSAARRRAVTVSDLSDFELLLIFKKLDRLGNILVCERVCQRWLRLSRSPSFLWEAYTLAFLAGEPSNWEKCQWLMFLQRRPEAWKDLELSNDVFGKVANLADPSVIILLSNAPALQDLSVSAYVSGNVLSTCCLLSQITSLEIKSVTTQITEADLNMAIQGMTSLKLLALSFREHGAALAEPRCSMPTALQFATRLHTLKLTVRKSAAVLHFEALPAWLDKLSALTQLWCDNCGVTSVPPAISTLTGLQTLSLLHMRGQRGAPTLNLSVQVSCCVALSYLGLSARGPVTNAIWRLTRLRCLSLDQAQLAVNYLKFVSRLQRLTQLQISHSNVKDALPRMSAPRSLTSLLLVGDDLETLPALKWLPQLRDLSLQDNKLSAVPRQLRVCTLLQWLDLSWNSPLRLVKPSSGRDDSDIFTEDHQIKELGLRRRKTDPWPLTDVDSMLKIAALFPRSTKIFCSADFEDHQLDVEYQYLDQWIN